MEPIGLMEFNSNINLFNDDRLVHIFKYLSILDRLKIESVCKRWQQLGNKLWNDVNRLELVTKIKFNGYEIDFSNEKANTDIVITILKRCGRYINYLSFANMKNLDHLKILQELPKYCGNITTLKIDDSENKNIYDKESRRIFTDENLKLLFSNLKKLRSLFLEHLYLNGSFFSSFHSNSLQEFDNQMCDFRSEHYYFQFLERQKNLKKIYLFTNQCGLKDNVVNALIRSKCENVIDLFISSCDYYDTTLFKKKPFKKLSIFLSKQKRLRKLSLFNSDLVPKNFLLKLPSSLEIFETQLLDENICDSLKRFKNLKRIQFTFEKVNDSCFKSISELSNLKSVEIFVDYNSHDVEYIDFEIYDLTEIGENAFSKLQNLEYVYLDMEFHDLDNILKALSKCKKLEEINISRCDFTAAGLTSISKLPNLDTLKVSSTHVTDEELISFMQNATNVQEIHVKDCENISTNCIEKISEIRRNRGNDNILEIHYDDRTKNISVKDLPLISFVHHGSENFFY